MRAPLLGSLLALVLLGSVGPGAKEPKPRTEELSGYAEWRRADVLIVDGQRVRATAATKFKGKNAPSLDAIALGYEVKAKGVRGSDGVVQAAEIEAKPNAEAMFEADVRKATDEIEEVWLRAGMMYEPKEDGTREVIGRMIDADPRGDRVWEIVDRLRPPYIPATAVRVHVVRTEEWNAAAMGNGSIWVYSGLVDETSDDELAIVLGHEMAHYSHEHSRRAAKAAMWTQFLALGALVAAEQIDGEARRVGTQLGALLAVTAFDSGYSRNQEDQADRVGLRYAHEAGYDVSEGPRLWERFRQRYGNGDKVTNFFFGGHSRPSDRIKSIRRELAINYPERYK
jgi:Zn-dependent protease with chaperone function